MASDGRTTVSVQSRKHEHEREQVPVVSLGEAVSDECLATIDLACREWGFFQLVDHGIDLAIIADLQIQMKRFFALTMEEKKRVVRTEANPWGYYDEELTKNTRDWKQIYDVGPRSSGQISPQWPSQLPTFQPALEAFYDACEKLAFRLLEILAQNLNVSPEVLARGFQPTHTSFLRLNYYPVCSQPAAPDGESEPEAGFLGINRHTDAGALTLLVQDQQPGLQVLHEGGWHTVAPIKDAITVNIGDIVQVWSNDSYRAALHRVLANDEAERFSAPFFFNPAYETRYQPLPSTITPSAPARYSEINWGEFRSSRAAGDYANQGEEIQISQFSI